VLTQEPGCGIVGAIRLRVGARPHRPYSANRSRRLRPEAHAPRTRACRKVLRTPKSRSRSASSSRVVNPRSRRRGSQRTCGGRLTTRKRSRWTRKWRNVAATSTGCNKKAGAKRRLSCWADRVLLLLFLRGLFLLRSHWISMVWSLNAGPIPRWTGRQQSDVRTPDWFCAPDNSAYCDSRWLARLFSNRRVHCDDIRVPTIDARTRFTSSQQLNRVARTRKVGIAVASSGQSRSAFRPYRSCSSVVTDLFTNTSREFSESASGAGDGHRVRWLKQRHPGRRLLRPFALARI